MSFVNPLFRGYYKCEENDPDDIECDNTYHEGSCECCDRFEECMREWESEDDV